MKPFAKVFDAIQQAIVLAERVETLSRAVEDMARETREMDRRLSRIEGALAARGNIDPEPEPPRRLPPPDQDTSS